MRKKFTVSESQYKNNYFQNETKELWYKTQTRVLYADTDAAKVVYHANYLRYFEIGRAEMFRNFGKSYKNIEDKKIFHPIVKVDMSFHYPAEYDDLLDIYVRPLELETVKFSVDYRILNAENQTLMITGNTVHCCITDQRKPCMVDDDVKELFEYYHEKSL